MKNRNCKKFLALVLALVMAIGVVALPASAASWTWRQSQAHDMADQARNMGFGENTAAVKLMQDIFAAESGENVSGSYYYSARTGQVYYLYDNNINYNNQYTTYSSTGITYDNDGGIWDGRYTWYWDANVVSFYRWNNYSKVWITDGYSFSNNGYTWYYSSSQRNFYRWQNGNQVWNDNYTGAGAGGNTYYNNGNQSANLSGYNYTYSGKNLYAGVITGINVDNTKATVLAKMIYSSAHGVWSQTTQAGVAWDVLYNFGVNGLTEANMQNTFGWYNSNAVTTDDYGRDLLALAKDVIFRYNAWQAGNTYVGQVLPSNYNWLYRYSDSTVTCRSSQNGADYTYPDAWSTTKSALHTPYST